MGDRGWLAIGSWKGRLAQKLREGIGEDGVRVQGIWDEGGVERWGWVWTHRLYCICICMRLRVAYYRLLVSEIVSESS